MKSLNKSQWEPKIYDPNLIQYEEAKHILPYTDGVIEYVTPDGIKRVKVSESEWNAMLYSEALQRLVLS